MTSSRWLICFSMRSHRFCYSHCAIYAIRKHLTHIASLPFVVIVVLIGSCVWIADFRCIKYRLRVLNTNTSGGPDVCAWFYNVQSPVDRYSNPYGF